MNWWTEMQQTKPLTNGLKLSDADLSALAEIVTQFETLQVDLPAKIMRYVVDGEGEEIVQEVVNLRAEAIQSHHQIVQSSHPFVPHPLFVRHDIGMALTQLQILEADVYYRLIQVNFSFPSGYSLQTGPIALPLSDCIREFVNSLTQRYPDPQPIAITANLVDAMLVKAGEPSETLARMVYCIDPNNYTEIRLSRSCILLKDFSSYSVQHSDVILGALNHTDRKRRVHALQVMVDAQVTPSPFAEVLAKLAGASAKTERELAATLLQRHPESAISWVQAQVEIGKAEERYHAVKLLGDLAGEEARSFLTARLAVETAAKVRSALAQTLASPVEIPIESECWNLPAIAPVAFDVPIPEDTKPALQEIIDIYNQGRVQEYENLYKTLFNHSRFGNYSQTPEHYFSRKNQYFSDEISERVLEEVVKAQQITEEERLSRFQAITRKYLQDVLLESIVPLLQNGTAAACRHQLNVAYRKQDLANKKAQVFLAYSGIQLIHVVRLLLMLGYVVAGSHRGNTVVQAGHELLRQYHRSHPESGGLRELAAVLEALEFDSEAIGKEILSYYYGKIGFLRWEDEAIYPYFAERLHLLENALTPNKGGDWYSRYERGGQRENAFVILQKFPQPPARLVPLLWNLALGSAKGERSIAQRCLNAIPGTQDRILKALQDSDREIRTAAAEWLASQADPAAIAPLKVALQLEKSESTKDIMLRSLEKLGASIEEFLDRQVLLKESQKLIQKGIPTALNWFPFNAMPIVHWNDTNKGVEPDILKGLLVQSFKQKTVEPNPMLHRYVQAWRKDEREAIGQFILESWMTQDILPKYTHTEASQLAKTAAATQWRQTQQRLSQIPTTEAQVYQQVYQDLKQHWRDLDLTNPEQKENFERNVQMSAKYHWEERQHLMALTEEIFYRNSLSQHLNELRGSAIKEKGILAIAAACCGTSAVPSIRNYIHTWHGMRVAQSKTLLQLLPWIQDNSAIQLLIAIATRFRTKGIQQEAEQYVNQLAERNGWTRDQLADRTIPTAGFTAGAVMLLDYGSRQFTAHLDAACNITLTDPAGKGIKSLPDARKEDDPEQVKAAKKQLAEAKKQLKQVLQLQKDRLYEAMCTQRSWRFQDWQQFLNQHPIVGRYGQRLVWTVAEQAEGKGQDNPNSKIQTLKSFRPLADGTLTDVDDEAVTVAADAIVQLAHTCTVTEAVAAAWRSHFADYEVVPLLEQFRPDTYGLPDQKRQETEIRDFEGYLLQSLQLRGMATKRGYTRGQTEDAGWFYSYRKTFPGLGIEAVINFSGSYVPEEIHTVALTTLTFHPLLDDEAGSDYDRPTLTLEEIPPVLLSEIWNDLKAIAAQGTGFDPDWEKKSYLI